MNERWVCKRCFADNEASSGACVKCGLTRGAESSESDRATWVAASPAGAPAERPAWQRWLRYWWVPALAVVLLVGYFASARRGDDGSLENAGTLSVEDLRTGDCFNGGDETEISDVDGVPCTEAHEYEVFAVATHEAESLPTDTEMDGIFISRCEPPFEAFVGTPYAESELYGSMITPSEESWNDGDRSFVCILYDPENPELTSSMQGANR